MPARKTAKRRLKKTPVGDMRDRIQLRQRNIQAPKFDNASPSESYTLIATVWSKMETLDGNKAKALFSSVNINELPTHSFTIRKRTGITAETVVTFRDENYDILGTIDPDGRAQYLELGCRILGDKDKEANQ